MGRKKVLDAPHSRNQRNSWLILPESQLEWRAAGVKKSQNTTPCGFIIVEKNELGGKRASHGELRKKPSALEARRIRRDQTRIPGICQVPQDRHGYRRRTGYVYDRRARRRYNQHTAGRD